MPRDNLVVCLPKIRSSPRVEVIPPNEPQRSMGLRPCLSLVNQIRCDVHLCASTLLTRKSESQYRQGLILARSGSPSFVAVVQSADEG
jgi:hypothetical protein